ncbi:MAG: DNA repair protein RecN [Verrucomicrobiota bacterium]|jgi:DNA repair protein RecN (Recombination protein N)|nr:DNA repair protein RecN [Verrucomicrobiota bacterium]MDP6251380.1 DNA repair protein RecN [Verrucomicrobiota bacterium]MDP7178108.1 DNA repair protein RecN [Verrucomicrobiota bacterium]MDP7292045.1 DNA repair protein RecN [Verrucomicrobiota bacterium]MDP7440431.1 DNA repair protein RecN [Verrucomicrobiota bacterium]|tara:strand:- start:369 stop:2054 length:1686 start_codon:yes stop_codon:yes gene_type:complete
MLTDLRIKNLALVSDLAIQFGPGYNSITGETGAGKSILIGALGLVLGERADRTLIRDGDDHCSVEAIIDTACLGKAFHAHIEQNGIEPCEGGQLFLKRSFSASGGNRQFINGSPTTLSVLASIGEWLVDIHGPHDHQSLLKAARQLDILDAYGGLEEARSEFAALVDQRAALAGQKADLIVDEDAYARELDLLRFQVAEIELARLKPDEEPELEQAFQRATHSARLAELAIEARGLIDDGEPSVSDLSAALGRTLQEMAGIDPGAEPLLAEQRAINEQLADLSGAVADYAERLSLDPERMKQVEERYNLVQTLKRKYGSTLAEVIAFGEKAAKRLAAIEGRDEELARLNAETAKLTEQIRSLGQALSAERKAIAPKLVKEAERQLNDLGFLQSRFDVEIVDPSELGQAEAALSRTGFDQIEFLFAPNPGEPFKPLKVIASSGEMARVMLALKTVLAVQDSIPVLVFDEVDSNVGGETAGVVGEKMKQIGAKRQVLCITHLAPVAAAGHRHYLVSKEIVEGRTLTRLTRLDGEARIKELTRMLGGGGAAARQHAEALLSIPK